MLMRHTHPVLRFPQFHKSMILSTDALDVEAGVLMQEFDNETLPIVYAGKFSCRDALLHDIEGECLAII